MKYVLLMLLSLYTVSANAGDVGYDVEVIVFKNNNPAYQGAENWHLVQKNTDTDTTENSQQAAGSEASKPDKVFTMLEPDKYQLTKIADRISSNPDYTLLYHAEWSQPGLDEEHAVDFETEIPYPENGQSVEAGSAGGPMIDARFKLVMSRYLHFSVDMLIPFAASPDQNHNPDGNLMGTPGATVPASPAPTYVEFTDTRRMRSREIHYIDHPLVGVIIQAIPFKIAPEKDNSAKPKSYQTL